MKATGNQTLFIVKGRRETDFLELLANSEKCGDRQERMLQTVGRKNPLGALAQGIRAIMDIAYANCSPLAVPFGRERCKETSDEFVSSVKQELKNCSHALRMSAIGAWDRHAEPWKVSAAEANGNFPVIPCNRRDGVLGKLELLRRLKKRGLP